MLKPLLKYQIGLGLIGLFGFVLLLLVLVQAGATKADNKTYDQASKVADALNNYLDTSSAIPDSLGAAGVTNIPASVTYQKLSDSSYQFCVDYKTTSSGFDASSVETNLITSETGTNFNDYGGYNANSYLTLDPSHHKGENCQTVKPYLYNSQPIIGGSDSSSDSVTD